MPIDIKKAAQEAQKRKEIYPKLDMGKEPQEGSCYVEFMHATFEQVINPKPLPGQSGDFLTILVRHVKDSDFGQPAGTLCQLACSPGTTLGDGILKVFAAHKEVLLGVQVRIEAYQYANQKFKKDVRGYRVTDLTTIKK